MSESEEMAAEFGTVAEWTAAAAQALGTSHFVPGGCRGSGGPAAMDWLLDRLSDLAAAPMLDVGAGIGGPADYARKHRNASVVLVDPERQACVAARSLFGFDSVCASAIDLPFDSESFSNAWCLGVLCTLPDHERMLRELARVTAPRGRVGMLVYAQAKALNEQPEGNCFPPLAGLQRLYEQAGFDVVDEVLLDDLPSLPESWAHKEAAINDWIDEHHHGDPRWQRSVAQESLISDLLSAGAVVGRLSSLVRREPRCPD